MAEDHGLPAALHALTANLEARRHACKLRTRGDASFENYWHDTGQAYALGLVIAELNLLRKRYEDA